MRPESDHRLDVLAPSWRSSEYKITAIVKFQRELGTEERTSADL
jgi:hypothetical protein